MEKIGLVLAGGGGRGAYQIGVWKALNETGLDQYVASVSGTSVGGLNAALFLQGDIKRAVEIWENISVEKILTPRHGFKTSIQNCTYKRLKEDHSGVYMYIQDGLSKIIDDNLDMSVFDRSDRNCYICCKMTQHKKDMESYEEMLTCPDGTKKCKKYVEEKATYFNIRSFSYEDRKNILLATSAMPFIFPKEKIGGYYYMDGGSADNLPVEPLYLLEGCRRIIIIHLTTNDGEINYDRFHNAKILEIRPRREQGGLFAGTLDYKAEGARRRIQEGYQDTKEMFQEIRKEIERERKVKQRKKDACKREQKAREIIAQGRIEIQRKLAEIQNRLEN